MNRSTFNPWGPTEFAEAVDGLAPVVLRVAVSLQLADHVGDGGCSLGALAERTEVPADRLARLLAFLTCRGVLAEPTRGWFVQTALSELLRSDHPSGLRSWLDASGVGSRMDRGLAHLGGALRHGGSGYRLAHGREFYEDIGAASHSPTFAELRATHAQSFAAEVATALGPPPATVVDVGGGAGVLVEALLSVYADLQAVLVDLPEALATASTRLSAAGLAARVQLQARRLVDPLPQGHPLYILVNVVHNWPDREALLILGRCVEAMSAEGRVVVVERPTDHQDPREATAMDLRALALLNGRERTEKEYVDLAVAAGLRLAACDELPSGAWLITFRANGGRDVQADDQHRARPPVGLGGRSVQVGARDARGE